MSEQDLRVLLMGYLDGELDEADRARVEEALKTDAGLQRDYDEMRRLKDLTSGIGFDDGTDEEIDRFWNAVYNRIERQTAWILLTIGFCGTLASGAYLFFTHPGPPLGIKIAAGCGLAGMGLLLWSVWRERRRVLPHDRYSREVRR